MSAYAAFNLKDSGAVERSFVVSGKDVNGVYSWRTTYVSTAYKEQANVTMSYRPITANSTSSKSTIKVSQPIIRSGVVTGNIVHTVTSVVPLDAITAEKDNALAFLQDLIATEAQATDLMKGGVIY